MSIDTLIEQSPVRIFEQSLRSNLSAGAIGVIAGPRGVGKTACLVHIAIDLLIQQRPVIHVSFARDASHIVSWYYDIVSEIIAHHSLNCAEQIRNRIMKNRVIMSFRHSDQSLASMERSIETLEINSHFRADMIVADGFDFQRATVGDMARLRAFARDKSLQVWMSASTAAENISIPQRLVPLVDEITTLIVLIPSGDHVRFQVVKGPDPTTVKEIEKLDLDTHMLLISKR